MISTQSGTSFKFLIVIKKCNSKITFGMQQMRKISMIPKNTLDVFPSSCVSWTSLASMAFIAIPFRFWTALDIQYEYDDFCTSNSVKIIKCHSFVNLFYLKICKCQEYKRNDSCQEDYSSLVIDDIIFIHSQLSWGKIQDCIHLFAFHFKEFGNIDEYSYNYHD